MSCIAFFKVATLLLWLLLCTLLAFTWWASAVISQSTISWSSQRCTCLVLWHSLCGPAHPKPSRLDLCSVTVEVSTLSHSLFQICFWQQLQCILQRKLIEWEAVSKLVACSVYTPRLYLKLYLTCTLWYWYSTIICGDSGIVTLFWLVKSLSYEKKFHLRIAKKKCTCKYY